MKHPCICKTVTASQCYSNFTGTAALWLPSTGCLEKKQLKCTWSVLLCWLGWLFSFMVRWSSVSYIKGSIEAPFLSIWRIATSLTMADDYHADTSGSHLSVINGLLERTVYCLCLCVRPSMWSWPHHLLWIWRCTSTLSCPRWGTSWSTVFPWALS